MQTSSLNTQVIPLKTTPYRHRSKRVGRKVFIDAFLFLLFLNVMVVAIVLSCLNNYLFLKELLTGGFIIGALATLKWMNTEY